MNRLQKVWYGAGATVGAFVLSSGAAFAVGTSQLDMASVVADAKATIDANLTLGLIILSVTIGAPLAISTVRRIIGS